MVIKALVRGKKSFEPRPMTMDPMVKKRPNNATAAIEIALVSTQTLYTSTVVNETGNADGGKNNCLQREQQQCERHSQHYFLPAVRGEVLAKIVSPCQELAWTQWHPSKRVWRIEVEAVGRKLQANGLPQAVNRHSPVLQMYMVTFWRPALARFEHWGDLRS